jgi:hypothetical protein
MKRTIVDVTRDLDLNTSAKKGEPKTEQFSPYLINSTYCVLMANLCYPIGSFNLNKELANMPHRVHESPMKPTASVLESAIDQTV